MRKLRIIEHISLDGSIQVSADPGDPNGFPYNDWTAPYRTPAGFALVAELYGEADGLILGRRTYDVWSGYWPNAPKSPVADAMNSATKYVVTYRPESLAWGPFEAIDADFVAGIQQIKAREGGTLILSGSASLTSALLEHGVADELILFVYPVLLGAGKRLFAEGTPARTFTLETTKSLPSGIAIHHYKSLGLLPKQQN